MLLYMWNPIEILNNYSTRIVPVEKYIILFQICRLVLHCSYYLKISLKYNLPGFLHIAAAVIVFYSYDNIQHNKHATCYCI